MPFFTKLLCVNIYHLLVFISVFYQSFRENVHCCQQQQSSPSNCASTRCTFNHCPQCSLVFFPIFLSAYGTNQQLVIHIFTYFASFFTWFITVKILFCNNISICRFFTFKLFLMFGLKR